MDLPISVLILGLLIFSSYFLNKVFAVLRIPSALLLILAGWVIGLFFDQADYFGQLGGPFAAIALNVLIYIVGKRFNMKNLKRVPRFSLVFTLFNVLLCFILFSLAGHYMLKLSWLSAVFTAIVMCGTSSLIIFPIIQKLRLKERSRKIMIYESLLTDMFCLTGGLIMLEWMQIDTASDANTTLMLLRNILIGVLVGSLAGITRGSFMKFTGTARSSIFASLGYILVLYGLSELLGFNGGFAVLCFGIISGNLDHMPASRIFPENMKKRARIYAKNERGFFEELIQIIQVAFFIYLGMQLEYYSAGVILTAILLVVLLVVVRWLAVHLFVAKQMEKSEILIMSILSPKGIIPAVLATMAWEMGSAEGMDIMQFGYMVILVSLLVNTILIAIARKDPQYFDRIRNKIFKPNEQKEDKNTTGIDRA